MNESPSFPVSRALNLSFAELPVWARALVSLLLTTLGLANAAGLIMIATFALSFILTLLPVAICFGVLFLQAVAWVLQAV